MITTITDNDGDASFDPITSIEGIHTLHYTAVDEAGNSVSASDVVSVDTTIPTNTLASPSPNSVAIDTVQVGGQSADLTSEAYPPIRSHLITSTGFPCLLSFPIGRMPGKPQIFRTVHYPSSRGALTKRGIQELHLRSKSCLITIRRSWNYRIHECLGKRNLVGRAECNAIGECQDRSA